MKVFVALCALLAVAVALPVPEDESPKPYSFNYVAEGEEGSSSHSETADGTGVVRGSYTVTDIDGRNRVVEYVAGPDGFVANVRTNEPGTENAAPASVTIESTADKAVILSTPVKPEIKPVAPAPATVTSQGVRYVLVPVTEPQATPVSS
ncbi:cuticle protein 10.9-like [Argiope bruennichi]|uniref:Adult-specific rigid cuticular protein 15.5 like protein n=1 Tax=Argiope bruennichi TaxID=94029 RepID=A0A8T0FQ54_ARGBR|nr:cuticle protein 10.9-like [Argiope bruennichi]KAF8791769.1 Adult-specific rigid cuticular protein 15.5 like protein [Argiope bruennichi]